ncbi:MAG: histidinol-phosphatase [Erysipelothrix sp.]|jgi:histidinol-phosphatase (PHP family)|nr:histidinol-phosphatase [Erysipelothrix sp.]
MIKGNYHTHTKRCKHAYGTDEEYVIAAIKAGFSELAFTDHAPWNLRDDESDRIRMHMREMHGYVESIRSLKEKYAGQIKILIGLEAEYFESRMDDLQSLVQTYNLDLLVLGNHFHIKDSNDTYYGNYKDFKMLYEHYLEDSIKAMRSGMYKIFAHPDLFLKTVNIMNDRTKELIHSLCDVALETNTIMEYNLGGKRYRDYYPNDAFWKIVAERGCTIIVGVDAHDPRHLLDTGMYDKAIEFLRSHNANLITDID